MTIDVSTLDVFERSYLSDSLWFRVLARALLSGIRVAITLHMKSCSKIFVTIGHETTATAWVSKASCAVEKLLIRQLRERAFLDLISWFHCTCGRESVTSSASTLISYCWNSSLLSPIDWSCITLKAASLVLSSITFTRNNLIRWFFIIIKDFIITKELFISWVFFEAEHFMIFFRRHVSELIDA